MYMREKTPIKEGAILPGKSHHYFFQTHSNSDKGHESNQTLRRGQERKSVCVCVECIRCSQALRLGSNKQDKTIRERKVGKFSRDLQKDNVLRQTSVRHIGMFTSGTFVAFTKILESLFILIGC